MNNIGRGFFILGVFLFLASGVFWNSLTGIILWRIACAISIMGIGISVLWADLNIEWILFGNKQRNNELVPVSLKSPVKKHSILLTLSIIQFVITLFAITVFFQPVDSGLQFGMMYFILTPVMGVIACLWQFLSRYFDTLLLDQLMPFLSIGVFLLPIILDGFLSAETILFSKISGSIILILCLVSIFNNARRIKYS